MRRRRKVRAVTSFTQEEVLAALKDKFYARFEEAGMRTGTLFMEFDFDTGVVSMIQYEGDVR
jgi:hypothetical protein